MKRKCRFQHVADVLSLPPGSYHAEVAYGTSDENIAYCSKEDSAAPGGMKLSLGEPSTQGQRNDLAGIAEMIQDGKNKRQIADAFPNQYIRYHRGINELIMVKSRKRDASYPNLVWVIWGNTGTGKTTRAHRELAQRFGEDNYYVKNPANTWWDGYMGEKGLLIDDFNGEWPISYTLRVLHEHPEQPEIKGSTIKLAAKFIIITSNVHPQDWYITADAKHKAALMRRITRITCMEVKDEPMDSNSNGSGIDLTLSDDE